MRRGSFIAPAAGILLLSSAVGASAQDAAEEPRRSGWYGGGGVGANWASNISQRGWNRDPLCYPTDACFDLDPRPEVSGYRWRYDIAAATGPVFELSAGFIAKRARVELAFGQMWNDLDQMFLSVTDYDGVAMDDRVGSTVTSDTSSSIDHSAVRMLTANAYYDFPAGSLVSPYLGAGVGPAFVTIAGVRFSDAYMDTAVNGEVYDPPLSFYNASQDDDLSGTTLAGHLHAGADFRIAARISVGLKLTYSMLGDIESRGGYDLHPAHAFDPDFEHHTTFAGARFWALMFTVKYFFGN